MFIIFFVPTLGMEPNPCDEIQCNNDGVCQDGECDCAQTGKTDIWLPKST